MVNVTAGWRRSSELAITSVVTAALVAMFAVAAFASTVNGPISRSEVIDRGANWLARNIPYSQTSYATEAFGTRLYRTDCSGFVSMAWHLDKSLDTNGLRWWNSYIDVISSSALLPGDALVNPKDDNHDGVNFSTGDDGTGHIVLFVGWTNPTHTRFELYEETPPDMNRRYDVSLSSYLNSGYVPVRYDRIQGGGGVPGALNDHDFDGDGDADIIARQIANHDLYLYQGNGSGGFQAGAGTWLSNNWSNFDRILFAGDWDSDGDPDLLARHIANHDLYLYAGTGTGGFEAGTGIVIGNNWSSFDTIFSPGDWDGDGDADLIARHATNHDLYLYKGNGTGGFQGGGIVIGNNWSSFDTIL